MEVFCFFLNKLLKIFNMYPSVVFFVLYFCLFLSTCCSSLFIFSFYVLSHQFAEFLLKVWFLHPQHNRTSFSFLFLIFLGNYQSCHLFVDSHVHWLGLFVLVDQPVLLPWTAGNTHPHTCTQTHWPGQHSSWKQPPEASDPVKTMTPSGVKS